MTKELGELLIGLLITGLAGVVWKFMAVKTKAQIAEVEGRNKTLEGQIKIRDEEIDKLKGQTAPHLVPVINDFKTSLDNVAALANQRKQQFEDLRAEFESSMKANSEAGDKFREQINLLARLNEWELHTRSAFAKMDVIKKLWTDFAAVSQPFSSPEKQQNAAELARALTSLIRSLKVQFDETSAELATLDPTGTIKSQSASA